MFDQTRPKWPKTFGQVSAKVTFQVTVTPNRHLRARGRIVISLIPQSKCGREDLNLHSLRNQILSLARLPISPRPRNALTAGNLPLFAALGKGARF